MMSHTTKPDSSLLAAKMAVDFFDSWFDPMNPRCALGRVSSSKS